MTPERLKYLEQHPNAEGFPCHELIQEIRRCWAGRDEVIRRAESKKELLASRITVDWLAFSGSELEEIIEPLRGKDNDA